MKRFGIFWAGLLIIAVAFLPTSAVALTGQAWIASTGTDSGSCGRSAPCRSVSYAYSIISAGGEINCIDSNELFSATTLTITQSVTIDCQGVSLVLLANGMDYITVNAGPNDAVILRGLDFESFMLGGFTPGKTGVNFVAGGSLKIENCTFRNFAVAGINFEPSTNPATLLVTDSVSERNSVGLLIDPSAGGFAFAVLDGVKLTGNTNEGLRATGANGGPAQVSVRRSLASANGTQGFAAARPSGGKGVLMKIDSSEASFNKGDGIRANGTNVYLSSSTVMGNNGFGLGVYAGGSINSVGNNLVIDNGVNGVPTGTASLE